MVEALACGTPVVATSRGAAPELVEHAATGYLASTPQDLARAVKAIDRIDRRRCRQHAEARFSMDTMARNHDQFYRAVIHNQAGRYS